MQIDLHRAFNSNLNFQGLNRSCQHGEVELARAFNVGIIVCPPSQPDVLHARMVNFSAGSVASLRLFVLAQGAHLL